MNPKKFGKIANEKQEPWKAALPAFIEKICFKRFDRQSPVDVDSIEEVLRAKEKEKEERRRRKRQDKGYEQSEQKANPTV